MYHTINHICQFLVVKYSCCSEQHAQCKQPRAALTLVLCSSRKKPAHITAPSQYTSCGIGPNSLCLCVVCCIHQHAPGPIRVSGVLRHAANIQPEVQITPTGSDHSISLGLITGATSCRRSWTSARSCTSRIRRSWPQRSRCSWTKPSLPRASCCCTAVHPQVAGPGRRAAPRQRPRSRPPPTAETPAQAYASRAPAPDWGHPPLQVRAPVLQRPGTGARVFFPSFSSCFFFSGAFGPSKSRLEFVSAAATPLTAWTRNRQARLQKVI